MISGLIRRDGRYSTRKVIPVDLQPHYGRREIVRALGTSDPAAAERAHLDMLRAFETEFDAARMELNAQAEITPSEEATPLADISPTAVALVKIDSLREDRDRAAKEGELAMFMRAQPGPPPLPHGVNARASLQRAPLATAYHFLVAADLKPERVVPSSNLNYEIVGACKGSPTGRR